MVIRRIDRPRCDNILDSRIYYVSEWSCMRFCSIEIQIQRLSVAVVCTTERFRIAAIAYHRRHIDVCCLAEELASKGIAAIDLVGQNNPICLRRNEVWV